MLPRAPNENVKTGVQFAPDRILREAEDTPLFSAKHWLDFLLAVGDEG
jgi:hypothetical protein